MRTNQSIAARQVRSLARRRAEAQRKKAQAIRSDVICTVEEPPGSGSKCGKLSYDGIHARCEIHRDHEPANTGVHSGFRTTPTGQPARRKRISSNEIFLR